MVVPSHVRNSPVGKVVAESGYLILPLVILAITKVLYEFLPGQYFAIILALASAFVYWQVVRVPSQAAAAADDRSVQQAKQAKADRILKELEQEAEASAAREEAKERKKKAAVAARRKGSAAQQAQQQRKGKGKGKGGGGGGSADANDDDFDEDEMLARMAARRQQAKKAVR